MHCRFGACADAASHCVAPRYEIPYIPTRPLLHGWRAHHSTVSNPSLNSWWNGWKRPSDSNRPRTSWTTTTYPSLAGRIGCNHPYERLAIDLLYGVRVSGTG